MGKESFFLLWEIGNFSSMREGKESFSYTYGKMMFKIIHLYGIVIKKMIFLWKYKKLSFPVQYTVKDSQSWREQSYNPCNK